MNIKLSTNVIEKVTSDIQIEFLTKEELTSHKHNLLLTQAGFDAEQDSNIFLYESKLFICGIDTYNNDNIRSTCASMIKVLQSSKFQNAQLNIEDHKLIKGIVEGVLLGAYEFNEYKSEVKKKTFKDITICYKGDDLEKIKQIFNNTQS